MQKSKLLTVWVEKSLNVSETFKTVRRTGGLKIINHSCGTIPLIHSLLYEKRGWGKINLIYFSPYLLNPSYLILNLTPISKISFITNSIVLLFLVKFHYKILF